MISQANNDIIAAQGSRASKSRAGGGESEQTARDTEKTFSKDFPSFARTVRGRIMVIDWRGTGYGKTRVGLGTKVGTRVGD
jgi:hypothetical protein